ncbi:transcriptional regulator with XRE-family HTH domain [Kineococcus xinjiangensis]|uniref:Transcriptional regulator with XRE-family HTH domain n=1 Tax=Kineococcus xinjiangensis TaxID=512762 RepID=A0A2S6IDM5_9ACTN|nr:helix-turn-helix domain-containing protein [Kineococcus xinjiangensis]PPK92311.1 transcriptional regulator with XRE-family HTH domain [Kineococcus xinjiangensis]
MDVNGAWKAQGAALGSFIRAQRQLADLSLRELSTMTKVSNAYLSQVERGLHQPSVRVLGSIAQALGVPTDQLLAAAGFGGQGAPEQAGERDEQPAEPGRAQAPVPGTEDAILADPALTPEQRQALLGVYRSFLAQSP